MFLPTLLLPLLGTAVSTSSASFDSWIYDLWMVVLPLTAVPAQNSGLRPKNSVKCAHPPHQRWCYYVLPFLPDSSGDTCHFKTHLWSSAHSSSLFQRGLARHSRRLPLPTALEGPGMLQNSHILHPGQDIGSGFSNKTTLNVAECHPWKKGGLVMPVENAKLP